MAGRRLRDVDAAERVQLLRVAVYFGPACFVLLSSLWYFLREKGAIPAWLSLALLVTNVPLTAAGIWLIHRATSRGAEAVGRMLFAAGDIPPPRSYPRQDVLIARGDYAEAAAYFRDHLTIEPDDNEARLRLADLLERHLSDWTGAERLYRDVRRRAVTPREELVAAQGLIDLYRRTGRRDRLKVELGRFAERYRGTVAGAGAAGELRALRTEDTPPEA